MARTAMKGFPTKKINCWFKVTLTEAMRWKWDAFNRFTTGTSLEVHWLRLCTSNIGGWVPSLVREIRSCMLHGTARK